MSDKLRDGNSDEANCKISEILQIIGILLFNQIYF